MIDLDEFYKKVDRKFINKLRSTGEVENRFWQNVGKIYNHSYAYKGKMFDDMLGNVERMMTGQKKHGFEQNKKTDLEKLQEKGREE